MYNNKSNVKMSEEHIKYLKNLKREKLFIRITQLTILIVIIVLWEIAADFEWIDAFITSQPSRIMKTLENLANEGTLFTHIGVTLGETVVGFVLGTLMGTGIAVLMWMSKFVCKVLDPYLVVLNSLPKIALGPILIVWIGAGAPAIISMAILISLVVTVITVLNGFNEVSSDKIKLLKTFGATKKQIFIKVVLPASIPTIVSALKINVGMAMVGVIVGEFLVSKAGLGYLIVYGQQVFKLDLVMTSVLVLAIASALMYKIVALLEKKYMKWKE